MLGTFSSDFDQDQEQRNIPVGDCKEGPKTIFRKYIIYETTVNSHLSHALATSLSSCLKQLKVLFRYWQLAAVPCDGHSYLDQIPQHRNYINYLGGLRFGPNGINSKLIGRDPEAHLHQSFEPPISLRLDMC